MPATEYRILYYDGRVVSREIELPPADAQRALKPSDNQRERWALVRGIAQDVIGLGNEIEHVNVWHTGKYLDMFVDETGVLKALPRNEQATTIYRANVLAHEPETVGDIEELPFIAGDAVLFMEKVWG
jgi:hypothetical protein